MNLRAALSPSHLRQVNRELRTAFQPLARQAKVAIAALFIWMVLLTAGLTLFGLKVLATAEQAKTLASERASDQHTTAVQSHGLCVRARTFAVPLGDYFQRVHALTPEQLLAYQATLPKSCPPPKEH